MAYEKDYRKKILNFYYENGKTGNRLTGSMIYKETMESEFFEEWFRKIFLRDIENLKENAVISDG